MEDRIAVVVPTRNSARTLGACLDSLRRQTVDCAVIVVDNASTDATTVIAAQSADHVISAGPERSRQRNLGAAATDAEVVAFIDSDMVLSPNVIAESLDALRSGAGAVIIPEQTTGEGYWASVRAFERSLYSGSDAMEAARVFRRDVFRDAGGFDEEITGGEDWDLTIRVRRLARVDRIGAEIIHDEGRPTYLSLVARKGYYGPGWARFVKKHGRTGLAVTTTRPWVTRPWQLAARPLLGIGLLALKAGEAVAVALAILRAQATQARRRPRHG